MCEISTKTQLWVWKTDVIVTDRCDRYRCLCDITCDRLLCDKDWCLCISVTDIDRNFVACSSVCQMWRQAMWERHECDREMRMVAAAAWVMRLQSPLARLHDVVLSPNSSSFCLLHCSFLLLCYLLQALFLCYCCCNGHLVCSVDSLLCYSYMLQWHTPVCYSITMYCIAMLLHWYVGLQLQPMVIWSSLQYLC